MIRHMAAIPVSACRPSPAAAVHEGRSETGNCPDGAILSLPHGHAAPPLCRIPDTTTYGPWGAQPTSERVAALRDIWGLSAPQSDSIQMGAWAAAFTHKVPGSPYCFMTSRVALMMPAVSMPLFFQSKDWGACSIKVLP